MAESIGDIIISALVTGQPILDFENLDFKIAHGFRKITPGNFKKQVTTAEGQAPSEKRALTGRQIAWMTCDFSNNTVVTIKSSWTSEIYREFN